ncbi:DP-EP family protein [Flavobacterium sp. W21_SRS_FM6]|uniref:DP-EP family protein n=1 Tax=Flavobacterium sp. W21_SRS_FM6 TaxID=3240268 RepID=UPI003F91A9A6
MNINVNVTVNITEGVASFSYSPDGPYIVSENCDVVFTLSDCSPAVTFEKPLISYVPVDTPKDITATLSNANQTLTLSDTDADVETIGVQLVVKDNYSNAYASPDPQIINRK